MWSREALADFLGVPLIDQGDGITYLRVQIPNRVKGNAVYRLLASREKDSCLYYQHIIGVASAKNHVLHSKDEVWVAYQNILRTHLNTDSLAQIRSAICKAEGDMSRYEIANEILHRLRRESDAVLRSALLSYIDKYTRPEQ